MKSFITILLMAGMIIPAMSQKQYAETVGKTSITQESIDGKFSQITVKLDDIQLIFRDDRVEIFENISPSVEAQTFLFFEGVSKVRPVLVDLIEETEQAITNKAFAEAMGTETMKVKKFNQLVYSGLYNGADLHITARKDAVKFELKDRSGNTQELKVRSYSNEDLSINGDAVSFERHPRLNIQSSNNSLKFKDGVVDITSSSKNLNSNASFEIILK